MAKAKKTVNASFTGREMEAIAAMLLGANGINVDPIIDDLYPNLDDSSKSMFRCKLALMLKGNLPEFQEFEGFKMRSSGEVLKYRCTGESSLLGLRFFTVIERYIKDKETDTWILDEKDEWHRVGTTDSENISFEIYESIEEAVKHW